MELHTQYYVIFHCYYWNNMKIVSYISECTEIRIIANPKILKIKYLILKYEYKTEHSSSMFLCKQNASGCTQYTWRGVSNIANMSCPQREWFEVKGWKDYKIGVECGNLECLNNNRLAKYCITWQDGNRNWSDAFESSLL